MYNKQYVQIQGTPIISGGCHWIVMGFPRGDQNQKYTFKEKLIFLIHFVDACAVKQIILNNTRPF